MTIDRFEVQGLALFVDHLYARQKRDGRSKSGVDRYLRFLEERGLTLSSIVETHIHADFASGATALAEATGAELALSGYDEGEHYQYGMPHRSFRSGDTIKVETVRVEAIHPPDTRRNIFPLSCTTRSEAEPLATFSGDFLFVGSVGRPDLLGEEAKLGLAQGS